MSWPRWLVRVLPPLRRMEQAKAAVFESIARSIEVDAVADPVIARGLRNNLAPQFDRALRPRRGGT